MGTTITRRSCLAWLGSLAAAPLPALSLPAAPALRLAREAPASIDPRGYLVSEKYDGVRALWDGQVLRFRSGLPVAAPAWFLARLPDTPLDGELWAGRGRFEAVSGAVRKAQPLDAEWQALRYMVFDLPGGGGSFVQREARLQRIVQTAGWAPLQAAPQRVLEDRAALARRLAEVVQGGGEGLVLHRADADWRPGRCDALLKLKPLHDAEAVVLGLVAGRGRHQGRMGALRVRNAEGVEFLLGTGFSDAQREAPPPPGSIVTYTHRGVTAGGLPRFASFLRLREV